MHALLLFLKRNSLHGEIAFGLSFLGFEYFRDQTSKAHSTAIGYGEYQNKCLDYVLILKVCLNINILILIQIHLVSARNVRFKEKNLSFHVGKIHQRIRKQLINPHLVECSNSNFAGKHFLLEDLYTQVYEFSETRAKFFILNSRVTLLKIKF